MAKLGKPIIIVDMDRIIRHCAGDLIFDRTSTWWMCRDSAGDFKPVTDHDVDMLLIQLGVHRQIDKFQRKLRKHIAFEVDLPPSELSRRWEGKRDRPMERKREQELYKKETGRGISPRDPETLWEAKGMR